MFSSFVQDAPAAALAVSDQLSSGSCSQVRSRKAGGGVGVAAGVSPWSIDPTLNFLNHGSYGAVPRDALAYQASLRERLERDPVRFYKVDLEPMLDAARAELAGFLHCRAADLAPIPNATIGLCTILNNTALAAGDEILITDHEYQSLPNELERICARTGAVVVKASIPYPVTDPAIVVERVMEQVSPRTKLAVISHVTSCTSLVFPVAQIVRELQAKGIDVCVDGAHSPGQIPVDIGAMKPTYFIGSGHKWLSGPKGIGFLYVRCDKQANFRPLQLSSRVSKVRHDRCMFLRDFDYQGTLDYSAILTLPVSIQSLGKLLPGGWPQLMRENHEKIMAAREVISAELDERFVVETCPESMVGCMTSIIVPDAPEHLADAPSKYDDALQDALYERHGIVTPVWRFGATNARVVRVSAQLYNTMEQYQAFGKALRVEIDREHGLR